MYLLSEDWLGLTTKSLLFTIVTTTSLGGWTFLRFLVLCYFVHFVALAFFAECATLFWYIYLKIKTKANKLLTKAQKSEFILLKTAFVIKWTFFWKHNNTTHKTIVYLYTAYIFQKKLTKLQIISVNVVHYSITIVLFSLNFHFILVDD